MNRTKTFLRLAVASLVLVLGLVIQPTGAYAKSYEISRVDIDATVGTDGSLTVSEERTFEFDGHYNGVYWDLARGTYEGHDIGIQVVSAQRNMGYGWEDMQLVDDAVVGDDAVYIVRDRYNYDTDTDITRIQIFTQVDDQPVTFRINYVVTNGVVAWGDVGELYWKYVSDGWDESSQHVTCDVHLPIPAGTTVTPGDNVRAWGHGPLNGTVEVTDDGAHYSVREVGTSEFAEARLAFPVSWLSGMTPGSRDALDAIVEEETAWADQANAQRERAKQILGMLFGSGGAMAGICGLIAWVSRKRYRLLEREVFDETYFRDVPSADHPSVLGALYNGGSPEAKEFTAALMRLTDMGAVGLDLVTTRGKRGKEKKDYRITRNDSRADQLVDRIDRETDEFLFRFLARRCASLDGSTYNSKFPPLYFGRIEKIAKKYPESYNSNFDDWNNVVKAQCETRGFFNGEVTGGRLLPLVAGVMALVFAFVEMLGTLVTEAYLPGFAISLLLAAMAVVLFVVAAKNKPLSREALEITAKMRALRRWLKDFTRLKEAIPSDVILWNRLLVMAVVLDVSDEVIEQLRVAMPQVLADPRFGSSYYWCVSRDYGVSSPASVFTHAATTAARVSVAELASSSSSSGGGGGGGFSGGGGGGFGGGGGGGAF